ncbi:MAG: hypothetical protein WC521_04810 [Bdellovibrionales bacterium]
MTECIKYYMKADGFDFSGRKDIHALLTLAAAYARKGTLPHMKTEGYSFSGNHNFLKKGAKGGTLIGDPLAMMKMARRTVGSRTPILRADGLIYSDKPELAAIVMMMAQVMKQTLEAMAKEEAEKEALKEDKKPSPPPNKTQKTQDGKIVQMFVCGR